jgi:hypothetical protein
MYRQTDDDGVRPSAGIGLGHRMAVLGSALLLVGLCSCRLLLYPIMATAPDPTKKVPAEFGRLAGHRVAIVVWADQGTLFEYPYIRFELAEYVAYHLKQKIRPIGLVSNREIAAYQQSHYDWDSVAPARIGQQFDADLVLYVEVLEYTTRGGGTDYLLSGRGRVALAVHDVRAEPSQQRGYHGEAQVRYPESGSLGSTEATTATVHRRTLDLLAQAVAKKFYDHEEPL